MGIARHHCLDNIHGGPLILNISSSHVAWASGDPGVGWDGRVITVVFCWLQNHVFTGCPRWLSCLPKAHSSTPTGLMWEVSAHVLLKESMFCQACCLWTLWQYYRVFGDCTTSSVRFSLIGCYYY